VPGRYSALPTRHPRSRPRPVVRRITTLGCSVVVMFGAMSVIGTTSPDQDVITTAPPSDIGRDADDASRGQAREIDQGAGPTVVPTSDANAKPSAAASLPGDSGSGHRVVYDITGQQVWLVEDDGSVARTYMVSGSRYDQLPEGSYEVFSASRHAISWHGTETMEYMVRFHRGENSNIGFHDIPVASASDKEVQTLSQLGTPLSDGCIRQDVVDAKALWDFAPVGTTVVVVRT
jgi:lipoprotein-anchoring transpeptidase ErfK/SrfK